MNVIETIRSEINRRKELHDSKAFKTESDMIANLEIGAAQALDDLLPFLDTIEGEYIRKEALMEWARTLKESVENNEPFNDVHMGFASGIAALIDKLNSL